MIAVEYHADLKEVQSDAALASLLSPVWQTTPFDRLAWWQGLAGHCGMTPLLAVARDGDALAILPLQAHAGHLTGFANWYNFIFRPVISPGADAAGLMAALARDRSHRTHRVTLSGLPGEDGSAALVEHAFRKAGWLVTREVCDTNHVLHVGERSYDEFLATRPGKLRTTLKRKAKKVDAQVLTHFDESVWDEYEAIYGRSWKPEEGSPEFLRAFAEEEGAAGRLRLGIARADGEAIAAQMWTIEGNTAFIHKLAHKEEARPLSPGSVLSAALFRHAIDRDKVDLVDFGTGNDSYKRDWTDEARPRFRVDAMRPLAPQNWLIFAKARLRLLAGREKRG